MDEPDDVPRWMRIHSWFGRAGISLATVVFGVGLTLLGVGACGILLRWIPAEFTTIVFVAWTSAALMTARGLGARAERRLGARVHAASTDLYLEARTEGAAGGTTTSVSIPTAPHEKSRIR